MESESCGRARKGRRLASFRALHLGRAPSCPSALCLFPAAVSEVRARAVGPASGKAEFDKGRKASIIQNETEFQKMKLPLSSQV